MDVQAGKAAVGEGTSVAGGHKGNRLNLKMLQPAMEVNAGRIKNISPLLRVY
jgi:hypothetical protein